MNQADAFDLKAQGRDDRFGYGDDAIFLAFAILNGDRFVFKIHILDPQADAFHQARAGAIKQLGHNFEGAAEMLQEGEDFLAGEDDREALGAFDGREQNRLDFLVQDMTIQEEDGTQGPVLGGGGDITVLGKVGQEGANLCGAHLSRMAFIVE